MLQQTLKRNEGEEFNKRALNLLNQGGARGTLQEIIDLDENNADEAQQLRKRNAQGNEAHVGQQQQSLLPKELTKFDVNIYYLMK